MFQNYVPNTYRHNGELCAQDLAAGGAGGVHRRLVMLLSCVRVTFSIADTCNVKREGWVKEGFPPRG